MLNARYFDMEKFAKQIGVSHHTYSDIDSLYKFTQFVKPDILIAAGWHHYLNQAFPVNYFPVEYHPDSHQTPRIKI